jgi:hypothetical protein
MIDSRAPRWLATLALILSISISTTAVAAQPSPLSVVQGSDGTLYLVPGGGNAWTIVPNPISDADLASLTPSGELDGAIPDASLGIPGSPTVLQVVQSGDGSLYIAQGNNVWTLVPNQIGDADVSALVISGELHGQIASQSLAATPTNTATPTPALTNTPVPPPTNTPVPAPTNTPVPAPTNTPVPPPINTPVPPPTNTPVAPPPQSITVSNGGGFVARFSVVYDLPGAPGQSQSVGSFALGTSSTLSIPGTATNVLVTVEEFTGFGWNRACTRAYAHAISVHITVSGTTLNASCSGG